MSSYLNQDAKSEPALGEGPSPALWHMQGAAQGIIRSDAEDIEANLHHEETK